MKLIIAFIQKEDAGNVLRRLREQRMSVTATDSEGGFLRRRNVTLFLALPEDQVQSAIATIREFCHGRTERVDTSFTTGAIESIALPEPTSVPVGGATILVLNIEDFVKVE